MHRTTALVIDGKEHTDGWIVRIPALWRDPHPAAVSAVPLKRGEAALDASDNHAARGAAYDAGFFGELLFGFNVRRSESPIHRRNHRRFSGDDVTIDVGLDLDR